MEEKEFGDIAHAFESNIALAKATAVLGMVPKQTRWIVGGALIDTGSIMLSSVVLPLLPAAKVAYMRNTDTPFEKHPTEVVGIGLTIKTIGTPIFFFHLEERSTAIKLYISPSRIPLITSRDDLDSIGLNFQTLNTTIKKPEDGYFEKVEMRNYLTFLILPSQAFFHHLSSKIFIDP